MALLLWGTVGRWGAAKDGGEERVGVGSLWWGRVARVEGVGP